jgi:hypothetical protein
MTQLLNHTPIKMLPANRFSRLRPKSALFTRASWRSLVISGAALLLAQAAIADPGQWEFTGSLNTERSRHTATLLSDGTVLAAGGTSNSENDLASSELYDPASGAWTVTGHLRIGRNGHTATLLTSGMVLVAGGEAVGAALASAELYDPAIGSWRPTG